MTSRRQAASVASERLRALSRTAYTAAAGHLEVDPEPIAEEPARRRWAVAPRAALTAAVAVALLAAALGVRAVAAGGPDEVPVGWSSAQDALGDGEGAVESDAGGADANRDGPLTDSSTSTAGQADPVPPGATEGSAAATALVVVHVAGQVARPGVVELPAGARVHEAVDAAGGALAGADLAAVNLARVLVDGEQVYVPAPGEAVPNVQQPGGAAVGADALAGRSLDLNTATGAELDSLPGIGPVLAQRIVDWRTQHGRFTVVEELTEVAGIGPTLLDRLRDLVVV